MFKFLMAASLISSFALPAEASIASTTNDPQQQTGNDSGYFLAQTQGTDRRSDRRDDRQGDRGDRKDDRQDCKQEEGVAGKDKRDCKQDGRQDRNSDG